MKNEQDLKMEYVGYKGSSPMHNDLLAGTIKLAIDTLPQNVPFMKDNRRRAPPCLPKCPACSNSDRKNSLPKISSATPAPLVYRRR